MCTVCYGINEFHITKTLFEELRGARDEVMFHLLTCSVLRVPTVAHGVYQRRNFN